MNDECLIHGMGGMALGRVNVEAASSRFWAEASAAGVGEAFLTAECTDHTEEELGIQNSEFRIQNEE